MMASTVANIGRSMKNEEIFIGDRLTRLRAPAASPPMVTRCGVTVTPGCTRCAPLTTMTSPALRPSRTTRRPSMTRPSLTLRYSILLSAPSTKHVLLTLIGVDRAIIDQDRRVFAAAEQLHARKQAGREQPVLVVAAPRARGWCRSEDSADCRRSPWCRGAESPPRWRGPLDGIGRIRASSGRSPLAPFACSAGRFAHRRRSTDKSDPSTPPR